MFFTHRPARIPSSNVVSKLKKYCPRIDTSIAVNIGTSGIENGASSDGGPQ